MYFSIFSEKFSLLANRYIAAAKNRNTGTSSVWTNP